MIGLLLAVFINVPLVMLGFPIISIIILLFVGVCKINDYVSNKSLAITDGEIGELTLATFFVIGGIAVGINYVTNNWNK